GGRAGATQRRQPDPQHRHAFALERGDRLVDTLGINLLPALAAEFDGTRSASRRLGWDDRLVVVPLRRLGRLAALPWLRASLPALRVLRRLLLLFLGGVAFC